MRIFILFFSLCLFFDCQAQNTETLDNGIVIRKDYRIEQLNQKMVENNIAILKNKARVMEGYRLMILNTSNKDYAFKVRSDLLQNYPDQKLYMWFANPYIRLKFGNFPSKEEAEKYRKDISSMLGGASIYLINETIEVRPGDDFDPDSMREIILKIKNDPEKDEDL